MMKSCPTITSVLFLYRKEGKIGSEGGDSQNKNEDIASRYLHEQKCFYGTEGIELMRLLSEVVDLISRIC